MRSCTFVVLNKNNVKITSKVAGRKYTGCSLLKIYQTSTYDRLAVTACRKEERKFNLIQTFESFLLIFLCFVNINYVQYHFHFE